MGRQAAAAEAGGDVSSLSYRPSYLLGERTIKIAKICKEKA